MYAIYALGVVTQKTAYVDFGQDPGFTGEHLQEVAVPVVEQVFFKLNFVFLTIWYSAIICSTFFH